MSTDPQDLHWWSRGELCESCNTYYCGRHNPNKLEVKGPPPSAPLGTTGLESMMLDSIEVLFLDRHYSVYGTRTPVGMAVYRGKSYSGRPGLQHDADLVAKASCLWLGKMFRPGRPDRPVAVIAVPPKPERRGISLPGVLAQAISAELSIPAVAPLRWLPGTAQVKALPRAEREMALTPMLQVVGPVPRGRVLIVDDVVQTGTTIRVVANRVRQAGATAVVAFAPSRAFGGMGPNQR